MKILKWKEKKNKEICSVIFGESSYIFTTPDKYYLASKSGCKLVSYTIGNKSYPFEQFDLKYNRPDIILSRLGFASQELIDAYYKAYKKRFKKMGFKEENLGENFHLPESSIKNFNYMPIIEEKNINIDLNFRDSKFKLNRYNIWINDIPLYGMKGKNLKNKNINSISITERITLDTGKNKIQVSCLSKRSRKFKRNS